MCYQNKRVLEVIFLEILDGKVKEIEVYCINLQSLKGVQL